MPQNKPIAGSVRRRADRSANTQELLDHLRAEGPSSQAAIARATGLSRATVNQIVQGLRDRGVIEYNWKNGREAFVTLASTKGSAASIMVHQDEIHAILFDFTAGERLDFALPLSGGDKAIHIRPADVFDVARELARQADCRNAPLLGVAIAIDAPIDRSTGSIARWAWQRFPHWQDMNIAETAERHLRVPVVVDNDANLGALAEWTWGTGRGCQDFLYITGGRGIGGGLIINGQIYHGGTGLAGEIGHMVIEEKGELCFCGSRGCLTSFATERAILRALDNSRVSKSTLDDVVDSALQGDAACQRVLSEAGSHLGKALATVVRVVGPSVIAIGGTLGRADAILLDGLRSSGEVINLRNITQSPGFVIASITDEASELGGLAAVLSSIDQGISVLAPWMTTPQPALPVQVEAAS